MNYLYANSTLEETYGGVGGYIYSCANVEEDIDFELEIPDAIVSRKKYMLTHVRLLMMR